MLAELSEFGDLLLTGSTLRRYERDYSMFRSRPTAVVRPDSIEEVQRTLRIARKYRTPVTARAGGSNTGGSALGTGIVLLMDHPALASIEINRERKLASVGAAARHDTLQRRLREQGLWLASDPSSGPLSLIGGNIATRASGPHALRHGSISGYVNQVTFVTADGMLVSSDDATTIPRQTSERLQALGRRIAANDTVMRELLRHDGQKWASGYDLLSLVEAGENTSDALPRLLCGSVGTLGILVAAELAVDPVPGARTAVQLAFSHEVDACHAAMLLREHADAVEFVSRESLQLLREHNSTLVESRAEALLIAEFSSIGETSIRELLDQLRGAYPLAVEPQVARSGEEIEAIWRARKALLPTIQRVCRERGLCTPSVINDVGVPPDRLAELLRALRTVFRSFNLEVAIYGHAGSGNLHLRPLMKNPDRARLHEIATQVYTCVTSFGGFVTAEHGMGPLRAPFLSLEWSSDTLHYMRELKTIFDPDELLNPGAVFPLDDILDSGWPSQIEL